MSKFKKGDKVRRITGYHEGMVVGNVAIVECYEDGAYLILEGYSLKHDPLNFELVEDNTKEQTKQWLTQNPWFIRVNNQEEFDLIQEWLSSYMFMPHFGSGYGPDIVALESYHIDTYIRLVEGEESDHTEIFPQFKQSKMTLESVMLPPRPEGETEQQKQIRELEETIRKASEQIQALKEIK